MQFLYPGFLWALAALAVPVIIHLFFFRRYRTVYFSNVSFLKEIVEQTDTRNRLKHLLVLIARCLAVAFLVFAFAQPFIPERDAQAALAERVVSIYVDNSFSMDALTDDRSLFELAVDQARRIANAHAEGDRFQLITNDLEGRHQRLSTKEEFLELLAEVGISPSNPGLERVFSRQKDALSSTEEGFGRSIYWVSDFQQEASDVEIDTQFMIYAVPLQGVEQRNLTLDTAWFDAPVQTAGTSADLLVRISNYGEDQAEAVSLKLTVGQEVKAISEVAIAPGTSVLDTLSFTLTGAGWQTAKVEITDYPVTFDDTWYMSFPVAEQIPVLVLGSGSGSYLDRLFGDNPLFAMDRRPEGNVDYASIRNYQHVVLDGVPRISSGLGAELQSFAETGGSVFVFPPRDADEATYNSFLSGASGLRLGSPQARSRKVIRLNSSSSLFEDVFESIPENIALPTASFSWELPRTFRSRVEELLTFRDGGSFLARYPVGAGSLFVCASPLDRSASDLPVQGGILVPLMFRAAVLGSGDQPSAFVIGQDDWIRLDGGALDAEATPVVRFEDPEEPLEFLPKVSTVGNLSRIQVADQARTAGHYEVSQGSQRDLARFSLNYDRSESRMAFWGAEELSERLGESGVKIIESRGADLEATVSRISEGRRLWKLCLIFALVCLAVETALIRLL